jgi:hypothetical protein
MFAHLTENPNLVLPNRVGFAIQKTYHKWRFFGFVIDNEVNIKTSTEYANF